MVCNNDCKNCSFPICKEDDVDVTHPHKKNISRKMRENKYTRNRKHKAKIMAKLDLVREDGSRFSSYYPAGYCRHYKREDQPFHIYHFSPRKSKKFLKRVSNHQVRKSKISRKGNQYRRVMKGYSWWLD